MKQPLHPLEESLKARVQLLATTFAPGNGEAVPPHGPAIRDVLAPAVPRGSTPRSIAA
jgi:hypothetical protein